MFENITKDKFIKLAEYIEMDKKYYNLSPVTVSKILSEEQIASLLTYTIGVYFNKESQKLIFGDYVAIDKYVEIDLTVDLIKILLEDFSLKIYIYNIALDNAKKKEERRLILEELNSVGIV